MPYEIVRNDITTMKVDAIVNAANSTLLGGGGVDGAIHRAAGPELYEECKTLGGCETGDAKLTKGYALPARYVIHTVGPVWHGGGHGEAEKLKSCYRRSLELAKAKRCRSVAFPLISAGVYGYPREAALRIAVETIRDFLTESDMQVYIVIFDRKSLDVGEKLAENIRRYIDDNYVRAHEDDEAVMYQRAMQARCFAEDSDEDDSFSCIEVGALPKRRVSVRSLDARIRELDESFSQMLLRKIDEAGLKDSECYKRANVDRKLFSKIRSDVHYRPSKRTAVALAIALELSRAEAEDLLKKAGYALSQSVMFDVIIEYFLDEQIYDIQTINEVLFNYDQQLLGA